ncbi:MAG TPA: MlaD family protein [Burkholderiales bacterium]|nr:MlaD family protein [Burkholderiales bacterium]
MENRSYALFTGLFTILLGAALVTSFIWFRGDSKSFSHYLVVSKFPVNGLNRQAVVRFRGVEVGKVDDISIDTQDSQTILVRVSLDDSVPITQGTFAQLGYQGLTGIAYVVLDDDGTNHAPLKAKDGGLARIEVRGNVFDDLAQSSKALLQQAGDLLDRLNKIASETNQTRIETTLANFEKASAQLEPALRAIPEVTERAKKFLGEDNQASLSRSLANIEQATNAVGPVVEDSRKALATIRRLSEKLDKFGSELTSEINEGTLPRINQLVEQLGQDSQDIHRLVLQIEREPQSLVFGRPRPQPGPGEPGFNGARK